MSQETQSNNKRIAKNTALLYVRMLLLMLVSLYTSRVVLDELGITDYGIYNIVGGIVAMLGFLQGAMGNAVQRFLSFEMGKGDTENVNKVFCLAIMAHAGIALFVFVAIEIIGVWYLNSHMVIPPDRLDAANCVLQCTILTTVFTILKVPYNAIIIAKEEMGIYAYLSIAETILKLVIVYAIVIAPFDRLKSYAVLSMFVSIGITMTFWMYCHGKYKESCFRFTRDWTKFREIAFFAGWNMLGEISWVFTGQGVNIVLNGFFGPVVNAAMGITHQVSAAVNSFVGNFQTAVNPQIIKLYASKEIVEMQRLLYRSTRFSYYLLFILSLPLMLETDNILCLWLKEVPVDTVNFIRLTLISMLVQVESNLLSQVARAYGDIRRYQLAVSGTLFLNFPLSWIVLYWGYPPYAVVIVGIFIQFSLLLIRLWLIKAMIEFSILDFLCEVVWPTIKISVIAVIPPLALTYCIETGFWRTVLTCVVSCFISSILIYTFGMNIRERQFVVSTLKKTAQRIKPWQ